MYAIIEEGGKQHSVQTGDILDVELRPELPGATIELDKVLVLGGEGDTKTGHPYVKGAKVVVEVMAVGKDKKVTVFRYKAKTRFRRKAGHRQPFTRLRVAEIVEG